MRHTYLHALARAAVAERAAIRPIARPLFAAEAPRGDAEPPPSPLGVEGAPRQPASRDAAPMQLPVQREELFPTHARSEPRGREQPPFATVPLPVHSASVAAGRPQQPASEQPAPPSVLMPYSPDGMRAPQTEINGFGREAPVDPGSTPTLLEPLRPTVAEKEDAPRPAAVKVTVESPGDSVDVRRPPMRAAEPASLLPVLRRAPAPPTPWPTAPIVAQQQAGDTVEIHIGRIEVTAVPAPAPRLSPAAPRARVAVNLSDYLRGEAVR